ncbi:MAG: RDD family protein [Bacteroidetes bacterium]|nr:RDD family protein [Bacteroidota bacterium]
MKTLEIRTAQNVAIEYQLADVRDRALALLVDLISMSIIGLLLLFIYGAVMPPSTMDYINYLTFLPVIVLYTLVSEIVTNGHSIGKKLLGIKVVKVNGTEARLSDYVIRWVFRLIDIYFSLGVVGTVMVNSTTRGQRIGDILANTTVIRLKPQNRQLGLKMIERMRTSSEHTPQYREVLQMTEQEMLLIKSTIDQFGKYPNASHKEAINEMAEILRHRLRITSKEKNDLAFLQALLNDYIILTR